jgi:hypothetical protein
MVAETWAHHYDQHATDEFWAENSAERRPTLLDSGSRLP